MLGDLDDQPAQHPVEAGRCHVEQPRHDVMRREPACVVHVHIRKSRGLQAPDERFKSLAVGWFVACGVREDDSVGCWDQAEREGRPGPFLSVSAGGFACGITTDEQLECWDPKDVVDGVMPTPSGTFEAVDVGYQEACAIRTGGALACWSADG